MSTQVTTPAPTAADLTAMVGTLPTDTTGIPCVARPGTAFRHLDGPCQCFIGGPAPQFGPSQGVPHA